MAESTPSTTSSPLRRRRCAVDAPLMVIKGVLAVALMATGSHIHRMREEVLYGNLPRSSYANTVSELKRLVFLLSLIAGELSKGVYRDDAACFLL
jgi:hypothetical protein